MTSVWVQSIHGQAVPHRSILYFNTMEIDKWVIEPEAKCLFCADKTSEVHEPKESDGQQKSNEQPVEQKQDVPEVKQVELQQTSVVVEAEKDAPATEWKTRLIKLDKLHLQLALLHKLPASFQLKLISDEVGVCTKRQER